jgi:DeoR/GlpR family transcriptional regulator of sugar metabolism
MEYTTAQEAVKVIKRGDRVFLHGGAATPIPLIKAMQARHT